MFLDVTRENNKHLAFGLGAHYCLGAPLSRLEGQIAISTLVRRMPNLHLNIAPEQIRWRSGIILRGLEVCLCHFRKCFETPNRSQGFGTLRSHTNRSQGIVRCEATPPRGRPQGHVPTIHASAFQTVEECIARLE